MNGYIYLLESKKFNKLYLGSTNNPNKRISYHNNGHSKATKNFVPWTCLLIIKVGKLEKARKIEFYIKRQKEKLSVKNVVKSLHKYNSKIN